MKLTNHQKHILRTVYHFNYYYGNDLPIDPTTVAVCIIASGNHDGNEYLGIKEVYEELKYIKEYLTYFNSIQEDFEEKREKFLKENPNFS